MSRCLRAGNTDSGFTLVEVLVSLAAMAIGFTILMGMHYSSVKMEMSDQRRVQALEIARTNLEMLRDLNGWDRANCPSPPAAAQSPAAAQYSCTVTTSPAAPGAGTDWPSDTTVRVTVRISWQERASIGGRGQAPRQSSSVQLTKIYDTNHLFAP